MSDSPFDYGQAFSRTLGWITEAEATRLRNAHVAIAGAGGVGGHYAEVLARLGVGHFTLADPDVFELANFNRQNGSGMSTIGKSKLEIARGRIQDINPEATVKLFSEGVTKENVSDFLEGADVYLDGIDFFVLNERIWLFAAMRERRIPAIISAPIGMGTSIIVFDHDSMSFDDYFGLSPDYGLTENAVRFVVGLGPTLMQRKYQVDRQRVSFPERRVPSTPMGCYLCAGQAATAALKVLLGRGRIHKAPWCVHYDAYSQRLKKSYVIGGHRNPMQVLKRAIARRLVGPQG